MEGRTVSHYRILARLGGGGMGVVYKAEDTRLKRAVALKFLPPELTRDEEARQRFIQEAQAASALDHPNICTIYEIDNYAGDGTRDAQLFIAMAYYDGETLKSRLARGPVSIADAIDIALQIARGLENAHQARIVHRDIKPANVMLTSQGLAKIVDFGIAKLVDQTGPTETGITLGTVAYMAPEQIAGGATDHRVDLWALGVVLYEMLAGQRPFGGEAELAVIHNVLHATPMDLSRVRPEVPSEIADVVRRAMARPLQDRYTSASELIRDLSTCQVRMTPSLPARPAYSARPRTIVAVAAVLTLVAGGAGAVWWTQQRAEARTLERAIEDASALTDRDEYFAAFVRASDAVRLAPGDPRLAALWERMAVQAPIVTVPSGALVSIKDTRHLDAAWVPLGRAPIAGVRMPRSTLRWRFELDGYDTQEFIAPPPAPGAPPGRGRGGGASLQMHARGTVPDGMLLLRAPVLNLNLAGYNYTRRFPAPDFLIDKFEITNRQFKQFVDANGYSRPEFWKHPFLTEARTLSWNEAMEEFRDRTGRPGPSTWEVGTYASGRDEHPVGGVSWYEAAAYAEFAGKSLPSVYHWVAAATIGAAAYITPNSNIGGKESAPVGTFKAVTGVGAYDMAGNVREWCSNGIPGSAARYHLGGSWADPTYMFAFGNARDPFDRSEVNGFRLVKYLDGDIPAPVLAAIEPPTHDPNRKPPSNEVLNAYAALYRYDRVPLDDKVESRDDSNQHWMTEVVSYTTAEGTERWPAFLFLPKNAKPPYQAVVFAPGAGAIAPTPLATFLANPNAMQQLSYLMVSGRALIFPMYSGTYERNTWQTSPWPDPERTRGFLDWMVQVVRDARRATDYLQSRTDIDISKVAYVGLSWGALHGPRVLAFEDRFKVGVLLDGGAGQGTQSPTYASVDSFNFAGRVKQPVLMVNGTDDFIFPVETSQKPLFALLAAPASDKRHAIFPGGHVIINQQRSQVVREVLNWLDKYLGPVAP